VPLPLPKDDYLSTFTSADARVEFQRLLAQAGEVVNVNGADVGSEADRAVADWVLKRSDVLVAVWDGQPPRGDAGTGEIVENARDRGLPIAWIHAGQRNKQRNGSTRPDGRVTYERL
jgi:hypothetical protein